MFKNFTKFLSEFAKGMIYANTLSANGGSGGTNSTLLSLIL